LLNLEVEPKNKIKVSGKLANPHPLIEVTREAIERGFVDKFGTLYSPASHTEVANIRVSNSLMRRSLRIASALFKASGYKLPATSPSGSFSFDQKGV